VHTDLCWSSLYMMVYFAEKHGVRKGRILLANQYQVHRTKCHNREHLRMRCSFGLYLNDSSFVIFTYR
jgi:hypothetical protein